MFDVMGRVMPDPVLDYEENLLEPLTSVFADYQAAYALKLEDDPSLKELPQCSKFVFELVSSNMLLEDIFAPPGRIDNIANR